MTYFHLISELSEKYKPICSYPKIIWFPKKNKKS
nr:MAG TPA: hypothetical protein [Caudoviricetes sp.]